MLNRQYRLRRSKAFHTVYRRGRTVSTQTLSLVYARIGASGSLRIGFSVSKKVGNSVQRNHVKRLLRENCRLLIPSMRRGYSVIFVARATARDASFERLGRDMANLLTRARILDRQEGSG